MELGKISPKGLNCNSGLDRLSIVLKVEKWLAEYRHYKIFYLKHGFFEEDYSIQISKISSSSMKRLVQISKKIPILCITKSRVQFKNETKVLRSLLRTTNIAYNKERDCYSVAEKYTLNLDLLSDEDTSPKALQELIWASIPLFSIHGTGQFKFGKRLGRNRSVVNRKLKVNRFLHVQRRTIEILARPIGNHDQVAKENAEIFSRLKAAKWSSGLIFKKQSKALPNGGRLHYISLYRILPNGYNLKSKREGQIVRTNKKTFNLTKREANRHHLKNINGRSGYGNSEIKSSNDQFKSAEKKGSQYFDYIDTEFSVRKRNGTEIKLQSKMEVMKAPNRQIVYQLNNLHFLGLDQNELSYRKIRRNLR